MGKAKIGANPFSRDEVDQMANLAAIGTDVMAFLDRCERCGHSVQHLRSQVQQVVDGMTAMHKEFGHDANG